MPNTPRGDKIGVDWGEDSDEKQMFPDGQAKHTSLWPLAAALPLDAHIRSPPCRPVRYDSNGTGPDSPSQSHGDRSAVATERRFTQACGRPTLRSHTLALAGAHAHARGLPRFSSHLFGARCVSV
ncbi:hypothetical protein CPLU01_00527 [Colletotrichum plurivorum]|uniref:Uncharacterized protein n=1 Tax=Colletotrichum plurivorum TaxID=2175906 RepID=A0A8H6NRS8_9PEZI|nr:hypothetical protein CPLU01_00527 [Colletotrichum plurivorum]